MVHSSNRRTTATVTAPNTWKRVPCARLCSEHFPCKPFYLILPTRRLIVGSISQLRKPKHREASDGGILREAEGGVTAGSGPRHTLESCSSSFPRSYRGHTHDPREGLPPHPGRPQEGSAIRNPTYAPTTTNRVAIVLILAPTYWSLLYSRPCTTKSCNHKGVITKYGDYLNLQDLLQ